MIRVLIVDDSAVVRQWLSAALGRNRGIEVVDTAVDAFAARDKILRLKPDVIVLDLAMPRMDGLTFLEKLMNYHPLPVVVVSSMTPAGSAMAIRAMELGAVAVIGKKDLGASSGDVAKLVHELRAAAISNPGRAIGDRRRQEVDRADAVTVAQEAHRVVAIGASTGGVKAIEKILAGLPTDIPGIVIAQHMPPNFTASFAERLNDICPFAIREARDKDVIAAGKVLIAPGGRDITIDRNQARYFVRITPGQGGNLSHPSIDKLFRSAARHVGANAIGIILTGMGRDGVDGLQAMRRAGAATLAQDERSSVVFGMPKEAIQTGAAQRMVPLEQMSSRIMEVLAGDARRESRRNEQHEPIHTRN